MKSSNIGGQAVLEGVMMRHGSTYAVAVRKPNGEIEVDKQKYFGIIKSKKLLKIPFVRGAFNFIDSLVLGMKALNYSASFYEDEEKDENKEITEKEIAKRKKVEQLLMSLTMILSFAIAIGLFMLLPYFIVELLSGVITSRVGKSILEGVIRIGIFVGYLLIVSLMNDIKRTYMYHGAEHKCINCLERGKELNVENVRASSKEHKRCGTSFIFFVLIVSIVLFFFIQVDEYWLKVGLRILLLPIIAGISYEIIKLAGNTDNFFINLLSKPGMLMQKLTTKEPDDSMIEVAIKSVEAVLDEDKES